MTIVHVILLASHLLAMNVASAGPLVCVWLRSRGEMRRCGGRWGRSAVGGLVVGGTHRWDRVRHNFDGNCLGRCGSKLLEAALRRFEPQAFVFALAELAFTAACLIAYLATWSLWRGRPWLHGLLAVLAATNLLYHFPPLMIVLGQLAARPELTDASIITRSIYRQLMVRPDVFANVLHFTLASVAITGLLLMHLALSPIDRQLISSGAWIALVASVTQLAIGMWVLMQLPLSVRNSLVGDDWLASGTFVLSIGAALGLMHVLSSVAMGEASHTAVWRSTVLMLTVVVLMTGTLTRARWIESGGGQHLCRVGIAHQSSNTLRNGGQCPLYKT